MSLTMPGCERPLDFEHGLAAVGGRSRAAGRAGRSVRPTISVIMRSIVMLGRGAAADHLAVAQHDDVVAEPHHVAEDVADIDDRDALRRAGAR